MLRCYPDPLLATRCTEVQDFEDQAFLDAVAEATQIRKDTALLGGADAFALSANQVGHCLRFFVWHDDKDVDHVVVNPVLVSSSGTQWNDEACLSLMGQFNSWRATWAPGLVLQVQRAARVVVRAQDRAGAPIEVACDGLMAQMFQHEMDHLDGLTILDRVSRPVRKQALRQWAKLHPEQQLVGV